MSENKSVLVVDDDEDFRKALVFLLNREKYKVEEADSGASALPKVKSGKYDLVLSDVRMPNMDGVEFLKELRKIYPETPFFLFISGYNELTLEEAYDLGAAGLYPKPFNRKELLQAVRHFSSLDSDKWIHRPPRYRADLEVALEFGNVDAAIKTKLFNIGRGGAFIRMEEGLPAAGTQVTFSISFAEQVELQLTGVGIVRWVRNESGESKGEYPRGFGIEFLFVDEPGRSNLRSLLEHLDRRQFIPRV
ncbi:MAG: response regulator [Bdellovibrionales bacterium]